MLEDGRTRQSQFRRGKLLCHGDLGSQLCELWNELEREKRKKERKKEGRKERKKAIKREEVYGELPKCEERRRLNRVISHALGPVLRSQHDAPIRQLR